jgi:hypothetical protein
MNKDEAKYFPSVEAYSREDVAWQRQHPLHFNIIGCDCISCIADPDSDYMRYVRDEDIVFFLSRR